MLGSPGPTLASVNEGESLNLRVEFDTYPAPSSWSWSYGGKHLLNTTDHVITVHRHNYRYVRGGQCSTFGLVGGLSGCALLFHVCLIRYLSELRLVRVLSTEGGIYKFSARNEDASAERYFHVFVNSKFLGRSAADPGWTVQFHRG